MHQLDLVDFVRERQAGILDEVERERLVAEVRAARVHPSPHKRSGRPVLTWLGKQLVLAGLWLQMQSGERMSVQVARE